MDRLDRIRLGYFEARMTKEAFWKWRRMAKAQPRARPFDEAKGIRPASMGVKAHPAPELTIQNPKGDQEGGPVIDRETKQIYKCSNCGMLGRNARTCPHVFDSKGRLI